MISRSLFENKLGLLECSIHPKTTICNINLTSKTKNFFMCPQCLIDEGHGLPSLKMSLGTIEKFVDIVYDGGCNHFNKKIDVLVDKAI